MEIDEIIEDITENILRDSKHLGRGEITDEDFRDTTTKRLKRLVRIAREEI